MMRFSAAGSIRQIVGRDRHAGSGSDQQSFVCLNQQLSQFVAAFARSKSAGQLWPPCPLRHPPVDPLKQHRQLRPTQHDHALLSPRPDESAALQALSEQAQPVTVPPQQLDQITAATTKAKHVAGERILPEHRLCLCRQTVEPLAHISGTGRQPYPGARWQRVHRSSSMTCRSVSELTSPRRRTRAPQPNTISMTPARSARRGRSPSGPISTGTIVPLSTTAFGNSCRRHLNSWLLFTSWRRATIDTEAPGACVSATIWRFNASEYCRRFVAPACLVSAKLLVDTCSA